MVIDQIIIKPPLAAGIFAPPRSKTLYTKENGKMSILLNMRMKTVLIIYLLLACCASQKNTLNERYYQKKWCARVGGLMEVVLADKTRCDCLTETHAIEVDFAGKWEAVEQALHYARMTGKKAGIVFICRKAGDQRKVQRTQENINIYKLPITIWKINCGGK